MTDQLQDIQSSNANVTPRVVEKLGLVTATDRHFINHTAFKKERKAKVSCFYRYTAGVLQVHLSATEEFLGRI
jgi:hypothetical protein